MFKIIHIPIIWGTLDLLSMAWYFGINTYRGQIPIFHDISAGVNNIELFGFPSFTFLIYIAALLYISPILSGILLVLKKKAGLIISYLQTPFRLILIIPPSIFFIHWPLGDYLQKSILITSGLILVIISETVKISTLYVWSKRKIA